MKCDCAENSHTKEDCPHDKTDVKKGIALPSLLPNHSDGFLGEHIICCCAHGARCTCSLKKEHSLDPVPEDVLPSLRERRRTKESSIPPRLSSACSTESRTTVFINGHHKPVHKANDIHNRVGAPYKIPARSHTIPCHREFAQRSSDSLPLTNDLMGGLPNIPSYASVTSAPHHVRRVKSEHGSPTIGAVPMPPDNQIPPISIPPYDPNAYSYTPFGSGSPTITSTGSPWDGRFPESFPESYFVSYELANGMESPVDWSTYGLGNGVANYTLSNGGAVPSQPPSYASYDGFSHFSHPGLTSSSGDISEVEDFVPVAEPTSVQNSSQDALNDFSSVGGDELIEPETFRLSSASSYVGMPQAGMLASDNLDSLDIDEYLESAAAHTRDMALQNQIQQQQQQQLEQAQIISNTPDVFTDVPTPGQHSLSVEEAQNHAHPSYHDGISGLGNQHVTSSTTTATFRNDPMMSPSMTAFNDMIEADERDDGWVR